MLLIVKIPDNAVGVSGMTIGYSAHAPARGRSAARAAASFRGLEKGSPQEKRCDTRLPRSRVKPASRLQAERARLANNGSERPRMQSLLHDAQNLGVLPAFDPDDAERIEAEAVEAGRIAIGKARSPQRISFPLSQNPRCKGCGKGCHGGCKFGLQPVRSELVKRTKLQAAVGKRRV